MHYEPDSGPVDIADVRNIHLEYYDAFLGDMKLRHPDDYAYVVAQYDGEISQVDVEVGRIVGALKARGLWDNTILVLMSDHGESFGEGELYFDHHGLYDAVTRIALLLRVPGKVTRRVDALVSTEDILPTLGDMVGLPEPPYPLTGTSLMPLLNGTLNEVRPYVVSVESTRQASLALRTPRWKVILPIVEDAEGQPLPDFYGRPRCANPLLFDLWSDPVERHDLGGELPNKLAELLGMLKEWRTEMTSITGEPDPIQSHGLSLPYPRFMERMFARR
jgi:arylsulfatase A-like enzyme